MNTSRLLLAGGVALLAAVTGFCIGVPAEDQPSPSAVWAHGNTVLVFATFPSCTEDSAPAHLTMQTLISKDGGKTWAWRGPSMPWSMVEYILESGDEIWLAGENYDSEGPASVPFLLLLDADSMEWPQLEIHSGYTELMAVARDERDSNRFLAWANHLLLSPDDPDYTDDGKNPLFLHESLDRGRTWHVVRKEKDVPKSAPGLRFFQQIKEQSEGWRISSRQPGGVAVLEHQQPDGKWHSAGRLPTPIQNCEARQ